MLPLRLKGKMLVRYFRARGVYNGKQQGERSGAFHIQ